MRINTNTTIPGESIITKDLKGETHYEDSFSVKVNSCNNLSIDYLTAVLLTSTPPYINYLLKLRNILVRPFGLETGDLPKPALFDKSIEFVKGERAVLFTVLEKSENEIVMGEDDKHLYFRSSVLKKNDENGCEIFLNTIVRFHNALGKIYFFPVKPFHILIMKSMLSLFKSNLEKENGRLYNK